MNESININKEVLKILQNINESININKEVLKILQSTGTETSLVIDIEKINSDRYTLMYINHDHEVSYEQADTVEQINNKLKHDTEDHEYGWELEHIFHSGKLLKYRIHTISAIEFIK